MAQIPTNTGKPITPKQVVAQWRHLPHKLYVNIWNFEVKAGKAAQSIFQESFDIKRFNHNIIDPIKMIFDKTVYQTSWEEMVGNEIFRQRDKANNI